MTVYETLQTAAYLALGCDPEINRSAFLLAAQAAWSDVSGQPIEPVDMLVVTTRRPRPEPCGHGDSEETGVPGLRYCRYCYTEYTLGAT